MSPTIKNLIATTQCVCLGIIICTAFNKDKEIKAVEDFFSSGNNKLLHSYVQHLNFRNRVPLRQFLNSQIR